jgi:hypothetical protein
LIKRCDSLSLVTCHLARWDEGLVLARQNAVVNYQPNMGN